MHVFLRSSTFDEEDVVGFVFTWPLGVECWRLHTWESQSLRKYFPNGPSWDIRRWRSRPASAVFTLVRALQSLSLNLPAVGVLCPKSAKTKEETSAWLPLCLGQDVVRVTETPSESQPTAEGGEQLRCLRELRIFSRHLLVLGCFRAEGGGGVLRRVRGCRGAAEFGPRRSPPARACRCPSAPETSADPGDQERQHLCQTSLPPQQEGACGWGRGGVGVWG